LARRACALGKAKVEKNTSLPQIALKRCRTRTGDPLCLTLHSSTDAETAAGNLAADLNVLVDRRDAARPRHSGDLKRRIGRTDIRIKARG
jgi:hypothetical protein